MNKLAQLSVLFLIWIFLEGVFRKWLFPSLSSFLFFIKYFWIALVSLYVIFNAKKEIRYNIFSSTIIYYLIIIFFGALVSLILFNPIVASLGLLIYLGFVPLIFIIPLLFDRLQQVDNFTKLLLVLLFPTFVIGIIQYFSPPNAPINSYARDMGYVALVGKYVRISSVFSYIGPMQGLVIFTNLWLVSILIFSRFKIAWMILLAIALGLSIMCTFMTGSRSAVGWSVILFSLLFFIFILPKISFRRGIELALSSIFFICTFFWIFQADIESSTDAFFQRTEANDDVGKRVDQILSPFTYADLAGVFGFGLGSTYQGADQFITNRYNMPSYYEEDAERIVLELGWMGFLAVFIFRVLIFFKSVSLLREIKDNYCRSLGAVCILIQIPVILFFSQVTFNWMVNLIYWFTIGLLVALAKLDTKSVYEESHC